MMFGTASAWLYNTRGAFCACTSHPHSPHLHIVEQLQASNIIPPTAVDMEASTEQATKPVAVVRPYSINGKVLCVKCDERTKKINNGGLCRKCITPQPIDSDSDSSDTSSDEEYMGPGAPLDSSDAEDMGFGPHEDEMDSEDERRGFLALGFRPDDDDESN